MDSLLDPRNLQQFLKENNLPLLDRFGQNFLIDEGVLEQIVSAADPDPNVPIIEIGAGLGVLTLAIAEAMGGGTGRIFAIELDRRIVPLLRHRTKKIPQIEVIDQDILNIYPNESGELHPTGYTLLPPYAVIGNIPYNITSKLIRHILAWKPRPKSITLLVDAAVAKRITAKPGEMSVLAVSVQVFAEPTIIGPIVLPTSFVPQPKVKSAILRMEIRKNPLIPEELQKKFFSLVKGGFAQKRKTLQNSLHALWRCSGEEAANRLKKAGIDPQRRPQTLSIEEWLKLLEC